MKDAYIGDMHWDYNYVKLSMGVWRRNLPTCHSSEQLLAGIPANSAIRLQRYLSRATGHVQVICSPACGLMPYSKNQPTNHIWSGHDVPWLPRGIKSSSFTPPRREGLRFARPNKCIEFVLIAVYVYMGMSLQNAHSVIMCDAEFQYESSSHPPYILPVAWYAYALAKAKNNWQLVY